MPAPLPVPLPLPLPLPTDAGKAVADTGLTGEAVVAAAARAWAPIREGEFIVPSPLPPHGLVATFAKACLSCESRRSQGVDWLESGGGAGGGGAAKVEGKLVLAR